VTGDTHLRFGQLTLFSPIKSSPLIPFLVVPVPTKWEDGSVGQISMTTTIDTQIDLFVWARNLERENEHIAEINAERVRNRGYLVFATDPRKGVDSAEYQPVYGRAVLGRGCRWRRGRSYVQRQLT
jgi:hypothetical protein